jgi:hypothetical protein
MDVGGMHVECIWDVTGLERDEESFFRHVRFLRNGKTIGGAWRVEEIKERWEKVDEKKEVRKDIKIEPWDDLDDVNCRWKIEGWGRVFEKDLVNALSLYARELQDEVEGYGRSKQEGKNR